MVKNGDQRKLKYCLLQKPHKENDSLQHNFKYVDQGALRCLFFYLKKLYYETAISLLLQFLYLEKMFNDTFRYRQIIEHSIFCLHIFNPVLVVVCRGSFDECPHCSFLHYCVSISIICSDLQTFQMLRHYKCCVNDVCLTCKF